jgi:toxin ParE1/3/4
VAAIRVQEAASWRLDEIYRYTRERWGEVQAAHYITGLFDAFERIETHGVASRPVPAEFGVDGFFFRYERHFVYWRRLSNGDIGIVTILHERMHQIGRLREDFVGKPSGEGTETPPQP